jgi:hypothetical protein
MRNQLAGNGLRPFERGVVGQTEAGARLAETG